MDDKGAYLRIVHVFFHKGRIQKKTPGHGLGRSRQQSFDEQPIDNTVSHLVEVLGLLVFGPAF